MVPTGKPRQVPGTGVEATGSGGLILAFLLCIYTGSPSKRKSGFLPVLRHQGVRCSGNLWKHLWQLWPRAWWAAPLTRCLRPSLQKCIRFNPDATVWVAKQRILCSLNQSLKDVLNYGLFQPASNGRDGKFLDEARLLREYPQPAGPGIPSLEVLVSASRPGRGVREGLRRTPDWISAGP